MLQSETVRKYDTYKDSGIEWIGKIPQDWGLTRLKQHYQFEKGKDAALYTNEYIGFNEGDYPVYSGQTENNGIMGKVNNYDYDEPICVFTTTVGAKVMSPKILSGKFCLSQNCLIMKKFGTIDERFLYYQLLPLFDYKKSLIPSYMQPSLRISDLKRYVIISCDEQQKIADYLDKKCGEIDKVVETEKSVIEKLKEYKQSIITEAVTKGLDKSVPLKDSNIEWIGKIPQHWEICKLLKLYKERKCKNKGNTETNVLSLSYGNIKRRNVENNMGLLPESFETYNIIVPDNIVLRLTDLQNDHRSLRCGLVKEQGIITSAYVTLEKKLDSISSNYYYRLLHTFDIMKGFYGMGDGVRQNLKYDGELCNLLVVRPSQIEQQQIAEYLDKKCSEIDKAIANKEQVIEKFTEYKKSLIYECVTGKRKVIM